MNLSGIIFMALSWGIIFFLIIFSFSRLLRKNNINKVGPRDVIG